MRTRLEHVGPGQLGAGVCGYHCADRRRNRIAQLATVGALAGHWLLRLRDRGRIRSALFPCLGFPLGVVAVYYGLQGPRRVRENPAVRGGAHAWVGIVCGSLFGLSNLLLLVLAILAFLAAALDK